MIWSAVVLLFLNLYPGIWGAPASNVTMLSNSLNALAIKCENNFLSTKILSQIQKCNVPIIPFNEKQLQCLMFYDINSLLCQAIGSSKVNLNEDYAVKMPKEQDVSKLCIAAKEWTFTQIDADYQKTVEKVFQNPALCAKICSLDNEDILNVESTYFCKYYNWGYEYLKSFVRSSGLKTNATETAIAMPSNTGSVINKIIEKEMQNQSKPLEHKLEIDLNTSNSTTSSKADLSIKSTSDITIPESAVNVESAPATLNSEVNKTAQIATPKDKDSIKPEVAQAILSPIHQTVANDKPQQATAIVSAKDESSSTINNDKNEPEKVESKKDNGDLLNQLEHPRPNDADGEDYQISDIDSDETRDNLAEAPLDEVNDPSLTDLETKVDPNLNKKTKNRESFNNEISAKEIYPNTMPDDFEEDDDHFFPFFLTAIIVVIVLYVLYHNKNKVTKLFFGLLVEGRQSGRRRNSRGHAYRRLDTLEQAMNANSAAPPSKIIY